MATAVGDPCEMLLAIARHRPEGRAWMLSGSGRNDFAKNNSRGIANKLNTHNTSIMANILGIASVMGIEVYALRVSAITVDVNPLKVNAAAITAATNKLHLAASSFAFNMGRMQTPF
jgi:hypothetical protein